MIRGSQKVLKKKMNVKRKYFSKTVHGHTSYSSQNKNKTDEVEIELSIRRIPTIKAFNVFDYNFFCEGFSLIEISFPNMREEEIEYLD